MRTVFSFILDRITDPLGLPIEWYWEWIILAVVGLAAYIIAYRAVGDLYSDGWIDGSTAGSVLHWIIRLIAFIIIWAITYGVIWLVRFITVHWVIVLSVLGGVLLTAATIITLLQVSKKRGKSDANFRSAL